MRKLLLPLLLAAVLTPAIPATASIALAGPGGTRSTGPGAALAKKHRHCDANYKGRCLRPNVSDYDCAGGSGNGPYYVSGPFRVVGYDHYGLDADHDGTACE